MLELQEKENIEIVNMIYEVREQQVMLDSDLAILYNVETKRINEAVKRNQNKFPERFSWQLENTELKILWSQNPTANINSKSRSNPRVFTEQGVAMLATILKSNVATQMSVAIMDAFVSMRKYMSNNLLEQKYINNQVLKNTENIRLLQKSFDKINFTKTYDGLFFEGQIYDSYSLILDILNQAKNEIIIIDNYIDKRLLDILRKIDKNILIITNKYDNDDYHKYKLQYKNITLNINNKIHDRFIIIDRKELYHCGASLKDLGKKCFAINKIENKNWINELLTRINI